MIGNQKSGFYLHNKSNRVIFDMEITVKITGFEDSLPALAALPDPSPDPLLQNLVSHAPEVRKTVVAQGTTPSNYYYYYYYYQYYYYYYCYYYYYYYCY